MEYVEGRSLKDRLEQGPLSPGEALPIAIEVAEALEAAHGKGIVHRDIKPGNIMRTRTGRDKVMDFGLAKQVAAAGGPASAAETVDGGTSPARHPNGRQVFFPGMPGPDGRRHMMTVSFEPGAQRQIVRPVAPSEFNPNELAIACDFSARCQDVAPDGRRFYAVRRTIPPRPPAVTEISLVQNWFEELKARVPAARSSFASFVGASPRRPIQPPSRHEPARMSPPTPSRPMPAREDVLSSR